MSLKGQIAEGRAWRKRVCASREEVALYASVRWELLDEKNRAWLVEKIMQEDEDAPVT